MITSQWPNALFMYYSWLYLCFVVWPGISPTSTHPPTASWTFMLMYKLKITVLYALYLLIYYFPYCLHFLTPQTSYLANTSLSVRWGALISGHDYGSHTVTYFKIRYVSGTTLQIIFTAAVIINQSFTTACYENKYPG